MAEKGKTVKPAGKPDSRLGGSGKPAEKSKASPAGKMDSRLGGKKEGGSY